MSFAILRTCCVAGRAPSRRAAKAAPRLKKDCMIDECVRLITEEDTSENGCEKIAALAFVERWGEAKQSDVSGTKKSAQFDW